MLNAGNFATPHSVRANELVLLETLFDILRGRRERTYRSSAVPLSVSANEAPRRPRVFNGAHKHVDPRAAQQLPSAAVKLFR